MRRIALARPGLVVAVALASTVLVGLFVVPADRVQGDAQRIMYVHVPSAWLAYLAYFVTFAGSVLYVWRRDLRYDRWAVSAAEIGTLFTGLTIVTGAIWGKVTWGIWWDWDPRLTTTAILFLVYLGYLLLRASIVDRARRARIGSVIGILGFAQVPIVHFSVLWWRSLHQPPSVIRPDHHTIDHLLLAVLLANVASFTLLFGYFLHRRIHLEEATDHLERSLETVP